jgi:signal transduction histidine kinase
LESLESTHPEPSRRYLRATERLVGVVQELSLARDLAALTVVVRKAARELTGADGATFVLREGGHCFYADEDAIEPLWKGKRFPLETCISGWVIQHREAVVIEDIYADDRIPHDAYRPTFVKSLAMVPIRTASPVGAIGNYWAKSHRPTREDVSVLQALADSTSIAMENVRLYAELEQRVKDRTAQLEAANRELESFSYSVSHELRAPLQVIGGFTELLETQYGPQLDARAGDYLEGLRSGTARMSGLIDDLLALARVGSGSLEREAVDVSAMAAAIGADLARTEPSRAFELRIAPGIVAKADPGLLRNVYENLLGNAFKFSAKTTRPEIHVGVETRGDERLYFVRDNGAGFDSKSAHRLFAPFQRLHSAKEFRGTGVGLATVHRIVTRHGGRIFAESEVDRGATFYFSLGESAAAIR